MGVLLAKNAVTLIALQRDRLEGRFYPDKNGHPRVSYELEKQDKNSKIHYLCGVIEILAKEGAMYLVSDYKDDEGYSLENLDENEKAATVECYKRAIRDRGIPKYSMSIFSAHQMGTCRIGTSPSTSACDEDGELWECDDLYVADASTFPTASGANPMLTTLAISHHIAK